MELPPTRAAAPVSALIQAIDWRQPWLAPLLPLLETVAAADDWKQALTRIAGERGLHNHRGLPLQFVPQAALPDGTPYESFISASGCVPTRDNLHDFFNALVWLTYPQIKRRLNELQADAITRASVPGGHAGNGQRGKLRDAATLFDENAGLLICEDASLIAALRARKWREVLWEQRGTFGRAWTIRLFGHALMEKLGKPYMAITAHAFPVIVDTAFFDLREPEQRHFLDECVANALSERLEANRFTPLPVSGVPGWWANQDIAFYEDSGVFRPARPVAGDQ